MITNCNERKCSWWIFCCNFLESIFCLCACVWITFTCTTKDGLMVKTTNSKVTGCRFESSMSLSYRTTQGCVSVCLHANTQTNNQTKKQNSNKQQHKIKKSLVEEPTFHSIQLSVWMEGNPCDHCQLHTGRPPPNKSVAKRKSFESQGCKFKTCDGRTSVLYSS